MPAFAYDFVPSTFISQVIEFVAVTISKRRA